MATNNEIGSNIGSITSSQGGTSASTLTANGILVAEGSSAFTSNVISSGGTLIGIGGATPSFTNHITAGSTGTLVTFGSGTITVTFPSPVDITWTNQTTTTRAFGSTGLNGYIANNASLVTFTLPTINPSGAGVRYSICGFGAGGWTIAQNAGQSIQIGNTTTTVGVGGSISSTNRYDQIEIIVSASGVFTVTSSVGTLTVV
jgi:hypothetical protein